MYTENASYRKLDDLEILKNIDEFCYIKLKLYYTIHCNRLNVYRKCKLSKNKWKLFNLSWHFIEN